MDFHEEKRGEFQQRFPNDSLSLSVRKVDPCSFIPFHAICVNGLETKLKWIPWTEEEWNQTYCGINCSEELLNQLEYEIKLWQTHNDSEN